MKIAVGTEYWKYGPTPDNAAHHWYQIPVSDDGGPSLPRKGDLDGNGLIDMDCHPTLEPR